MWHIIKAEIECQKPTWFGLCIFLLLTMPVLQFVAPASYSETGLKVMLNLTKGFAIIIVLLVLRTALEYLANPRFLLHLRLPIPVAQLGIVRISNIFSLSVCVFLLLLVNFSLFPPQLQTTVITATLWLMAFLLISASLMLIAFDFLHGRFRIKSEQLIMFLFIIQISAAFSLNSYRHSLLSLPLLHLFGVYILGLLLLVLSTYTFARSRS